MSIPGVINKFMRKKGLPREIDEKTVRVLILGSFPGEESLRKREYYGNPRNKFWEIVFKALKKADPVCYKKRINVLKKTGIGLWDVIGSCERNGSLDSAILYEKVNDFEMLNNFPKLEVICFNGQRAEKLFNEHYDIVGIKSYSLPSTSPAHAGMSQSEKLRKWRSINR